MISNDFQLPVTKIEIPKQLKQRVVLDKLAKLVSKHGYEVEKEVQEQVELNRIKD